MSVVYVLKYEVSFVIANSTFNHKKASRKTELIFIMTLK